MVTNRTAHQDNVTFAYLIQTEVQSRIADAYTGCGQIQTTALTTPQDLGVTCHNLDTRLAGCLGKTDDNAFQLCDLKTFLNECIQGQVLWNGASDSQVIDGTMYSQRANITARELQWLDGKTICCENHFT